MYNLFVDTAYKFLTVAIEKDGKIFSAYSSECFKKQSEQLFVVMDKIFNEANIDKSDIGAVYITKGPGSYTGVRISMTLAKVLCEIKKINLFTISTLQLYANNNSKTMVVMDARANRAFVGIYDKGECILKDQPIELNKIELKDYNVVLDGNLVGKEYIEPNIVECFLNCKSQFEEVKDINHLTPEYLKESDSYYR